LEDERVEVGKTFTAGTSLRTRTLKTIKWGVTLGTIIVGGLIATPGQEPAGAPGKTELDFLKKHWELPVPPQGKPPASFSEIESSLDPASCGVCHRSQFEDWKSTIHSRSVGPGLLGQTPSMLRNDPETAVMCYTCHAPLSEQQEIFRIGSRYKKNSGFDSKLQHQGLTCAGCHVRAYQRFGPPRRDGSLEGEMPRSEAPHGGATRTGAFERAEFCMGCHQFEEGDKALNGKLLENTYNEWKDSPYAREGVACQQCHMPDRRHLWRGIHDPQMVKRGVSIELRTNQPHYDVGETLDATLTLTNVGVGHYFPSYVTPKVVLRMELIDSSGHPIADSVQEQAVNREVTIDISEEIADTRIPPKGKHEFRYVRSVDRKGLTLRARVTVYPDEFYRRFYEAKLRGRLPKEERTRLTEALRDARQSSYTLFERQLRL
jgi:hypothetical protein